MPTFRVTATYVQHFTAHIEIEAASQAAADEQAKHLIAAGEFEGSYDWDSEEPAEIVSVVPLS